MNKYIVFFISLALINLAYLGYKILLDPSTPESQRPTGIMHIDDLQESLENARVEDAFWDDLTLALFFDNNYHLSIPYDWEIYERNSTSEDPILTKDDYIRKSEDDIERKKCNPLENEKFLGFDTLNSSLIIHFENQILAIPIEYLNDDGSVVIAIGDPSQRVYRLAI